MGLNRNLLFKCTLLILSCLSLYSNAQECQIGWPAIVAPENQDGDTDITIFVQSPFAGAYEEYIIGGTSTSGDLTEFPDECEVNGCAYIVRWKKIGSIFKQHTVMTSVQSVVAIEYDYTVNVGAYLYLKIESASQGYYVIQFNTWDEEEEEIIFGERAYTIKKPVDLSFFSDHTNPMIFKDGLVQMISNDPDRETIYSYWMILEDTSVQQVHIAEFWEAELETDGGYFKGAPTRLYNIGYGYDTDNVIVLGSLTYPKGEAEFGGATVLGAATNYMVVISRSMDQTGVPFTFQDKVYGVQQVSPTMYYYYQMYTLAYLTNVAGFYKSDVYLHLAGLHTVRREEIYLTTYIIKENHDLDHQYTRIFTAEGNVQLLGVDRKRTDDADDLWEMYVFYVETSISNRGKMLYTNMETSYEVVVYYFQEEQNAIDRNPMNIYIKAFYYDRESDIFMWAGKANYVKGYGDETSETFSWMGTRRTFGYFTLWTTNEVCYTDEDKEILSWGPRKQTYLDGLEEYDFKERDDIIPARAPAIQWNMGDTDDEDWDKLLLAQKKIDEDGFWVEYRSWRYYDEEDNEEEYIMYYIEADEWVDRFNTRTSVEWQGKTRDGNIAITILGLWGIGQIGLAVAAWYAFLDNLDGDIYWGAWTFVFSVVVGLQGGLFLVWPTSYYGNSMSIKFAYSLAFLSLFGPYGLYEIGFLFVLLTMVAWPTESGYEATGLIANVTTEKIVWLTVMAVDFGINSFLSIWFTPQVKEYRDGIVALEEEEQAAADAELQEDGSAIAIGGDGVVFF